MINRASEYMYMYVTGGRRFSEGTSADREIQRTLMEVSVTSLLRKRGMNDLCF